MRSSILNLMVKQKSSDEIILIIQSHKKEIISKFNKQKLVESCDYFKKLLTNFPERTTIQVPNAHITYDIIMGFFDQKS